MSRGPWDGNGATLIIVVIGLSIIAFIGENYFYLRGYQNANEANVSQNSKYAENNSAYRKCLDRATIEEVRVCYFNAPNKHRSEDRAEQDLNAQIEMAQWAKAMFLATVVTFIVGAIGVYYVWKTLIETRQIGQAQVRAYFAHPIIDFNVGDGAKKKSMKVTAAWKNVGQTPALKVGFQSWYELVDTDSTQPIIEGLTEDFRNRDIGDKFISAGESNWYDVCEIYWDDLNILVTGKKVLLIYNLACFEDIFGSQRYHESCVLVKFPLRIKDSDFKFVIYPHHNNQSA